MPILSAEQSAIHLHSVTTQVLDVGDVTGELDDLSGLSCCKICKEQNCPALPTSSNRCKPPVKAMLRLALLQASSRHERPEAVRGASVASLHVWKMARSCLPSACTLSIETRWLVRLRDTCSETSKIRRSYVHDKQLSNCPVSDMQFN